jgi:hypothetical protein
MRNWKIKSQIFYSLVIPAWFVYENVDGFGFERYTVVLLNFYDDELLGLSPPLFLSPTNLVTFADTQNGEWLFWKMHLKYFSIQKLCDPFCQAQNRHSRWYF